MCSRDWKVVIIDDSGDVDAISVYEELVEVWDKARRDGKAHGMDSVLVEHILILIHKLWRKPTAGMRGTETYRPLFGYSIPCW